MRNCTEAEKKMDFAQDAERYWIEKAIIAPSAWKKKENIAVKRKNFVKHTEFVRSAIKKSCMVMRSNAYHVESSIGSMA